MTLSKSNYLQNKAIEDFLAEKRVAGTAFSKQEIAYVNGFQGYGGMAKHGATGKGLLSEYFTPIPLVKKMVALAYEHGYKGGAVLEPSCGIGNFLHFFRPTTPVDAYEINATSYEIASLNFPKFNIHQQYFNELFVSRNGQAKAFEAKYELVIGNPPYGDFIGKFSSKERQITGATRYEDYFITRGLDVLQSGGLLVFVIPSGFLDGQPTKVKTNIEAKADLLDAYRLPKGIFAQTDIQTDIVIFKKK